MITAITLLQSLTPYGQSRFIGKIKPPTQASNDFEQATWRERLHYDEETKEVYIPPMAFKNCLSEAAKYLAIQVPGKGKTTYTKHFEAGVLVSDPLPLGITRDEVSGTPLLLNADGRRGSGTRVQRTMPTIPSWKGEVTWHILDQTISLEVFYRVLKEAGSLIGIGFFRPRNNGFWGRFKLVKLSWAGRDIDLEVLAQAVAENIPYATCLAKLAK
jgi:hypothetical protein